MNTKAIPELSYFKLKLTTFLSEHQPESSCKMLHSFLLALMQHSQTIVMLWRKASLIPKLKALPAMFSLKVCISQSTTP